MSLIEKPNLLSLLILGGVVVVATAYGFLTYTQSPDLEHYTVDPDYTFAYNFDSPDAVIELPNDLDEISGLTPWFDDDHLGAIQDEDGEFFVLNAKSGKIIRTIEFSDDRDYEGVAKVNDTVYVLEADGDLWTFQVSDSIDEYDANKIETGFSYRNDTEGIAYDPQTNSLLIVPKEKELNPDEEEDYRHGIYSFDLQQMRLDAQPTYYIDEFEIGDAIYGKRSRYNFKPSGISVDPISGDIYVIGSVGKIMIVINRESEILQIELLKENIFRQPEGVEFNAAGDLFISSEARGGQAILAKFSRAQVARSKEDADNE